MQFRLSVHPSAGGGSHVAVPNMIKAELKGAFKPGLLAQPLLIECGELRATILRAVRVR